MALGYYVLPKGLGVPIGFTPDGLENLVEFGDYFSYFTRMLLVFGLAVELPFFLVLLNLAGVVTGAQLGRHRSIIMMATVVFAAIATPSTDPFSMSNAGRPDDGALPRRGGHHTRRRSSPRRPRARPGADRGLTCSRPRGTPLPRRVAGVPMPKVTPARPGRIWPFLGPAFVAAVAYVDPGNFATNIAAGSAYGYLLVWVVVVSNPMAMLIQYLAAKAGIATGLSLPELCREHSRRRSRPGCGRRPRWCASRPTWPRWSAARWR